MPRYVSPGRTPSPSRSPSRTSRGRTYTDGVYTPSSSSSRSPSPRRSRSRSRRGRSTKSRSRARRSPSSDYYYSDSYDSRSRSRSRSTARTKQSTRSRIASALDTSGSTGQEKAENVLKTSLVMLGAIGAASLAAHKFWPKGVTYGGKDDWQVEDGGEKNDKEKSKGKLREGRDNVQGRNSGAPDPDRKRYIEERYRNRPRLPPTMDGDGGADFWDKRERLPARQRYIASYDDAAPPRRRIEPPPAPDDVYPPAPRRRIEPAPGDYERDFAPPPPVSARRRNEPSAPAPPPPTNYADPGGSVRGGGGGGGSDEPPPPIRRPVAERDDMTNRAEPARSRAGGDPSESEMRRGPRIIDDGPPPPRSRIMVDDGPPPPRSRIMVDDGLPPPPRSRTTVMLDDGPPPPPPPPPAPAPPRSFASSPPLIAPSGTSRSGVSSGTRAPRYYVDGETIVVPSVGERSFVVQRDAPLGSRLRQREAERGSR